MVADRIDMRYKPSWSPIWAIRLVFRTVADIIPTTKGNTFLYVNLVNHFLFNFVVTKKNIKLILDLAE
jgi:hypothetical protein